MERPRDQCQYPIRATEPRDLKYGRNRYNVRTLDRAKSKVLEAYRSSHLTVNQQTNPNYVNLISPNTTKAFSRRGLLQILGYYVNKRKLHSKTTMEHLHACIEMNSREQDPSSMEEYPTYMEVSSPPT